MGVDFQNSWEGAPGHNSSWVFRGQESFSAMSSSSSSRSGGELDVLTPYFLEMDLVTNERLAAFLQASGCSPADTASFLRNWDWRGGGGGATYPDCWGQ